MQYFIEIFTPTKFHEILHHYLPEPNRVCLVGVYAVTLDPTFLIWNNLRDLVYQTPIPKVPESDSGSFRIPGHVTTKHLPDTPC